MSERVLVFGGRGFIGGRLVDLVIREGHEVSIFDRQDGRFDVLDPIIVREEFDTFHPTIVYYLITPSFAEAKGNSPLHIDAGVTGALNVGQTAIAAGVRRIVWASSAMVYSPDPVDKAESFPVRPQNLYGLSKVMMEDIARYVGQSTIARFFNVYGPTQKDARIIPHIVGSIRQQMKTGGDLSIELGNVTSQRDFVYVDDVAQAILDLGLLKTSETVNIGTGVGTSILGVVQIIESIIGRPIEIKIDKDRVRPDEWPRLVAETKHLRVVLPHAASFRLLQRGLAEML